MQVKDVMTVDVVSVDPDASVMQAVRLMLQKRISGLPVVDSQGTLVGIVTEGDLLRRGELGTQRKRPRWLEFLIGPGQLASEYVQACGRKIREVMSPEVQTAGEDMPLADVVNTMEKNGIKRMPVVRDGRVVGIVSRANLLHALAALAREAKPGSIGDDDIREHILAKLKDTSWAPVNLINVVVRNGVVELWGSIFDMRQRDALKVVAENAPGVRAVEDHLAWVDPHSGIVILPAEENDTPKVAPVR